MLLLLLPLLLVEDLPWSTVCLFLILLGCLVSSSFSARWAGRCSGRTSLNDNSLVFLSSPLVGFSTRMDRGAVE